MIQSLSIGVIVASFSVAVASVAASGHDLSTEKAVYILGVSLLFGCIAARLWWLKCRNRYPNPHNIPPSQIDPYAH
jgi:protein-S-isoprenylcysteine O-methyltransferase Ste14